jgi:sec-independent protein translocase protein TatA
VLFDNIGGGELFVIVLVLFIFFGPKRLPEMGKNLGKAVREFRNALRSVKQDLDQTTRID